MRKGRTTANSSTQPNINATNFKILGTFEGECADATITNENGLDIPPEVWSNVFSSDIYKQAIDLGWYIGFLGHPDDPNCMDFKHACIVMTEGHIDSDGKVHGKFNLVDTPVGQIVKSFIDAGVTFGISVRGAGDIVDNSVDPDTFIFRGFDLVTFPAYPESIPTFSEIAASTDLNKRAKYKAVCAAVKKNLDNIDSPEALEVIQSQFAPQSAEYSAVAKRKDSLTKLDCDSTEDVIKQKLEAMTKLYLEQVEANRQLVLDNQKISKDVAAIEAKYNRKIASLKRITASQLSELTADCKSYKNKYKTVISANAKLKNELESIQAANLKYKQKIESATSNIRNKDSVISSLQAELNETVNDASTNQIRTSNLDATNKKLREDIKAAHQLVEEYQNAYANLYASAIGAKAGSISVSATTSVAELQKLVSGSTSTSNMSTVFVEPEPIEIIDQELDDADIITI